MFYHFLPHSTGRSRRGPGSPRPPPGWPSCAPRQPPRRVQEPGMGLIPSQIQGDREPPRPPAHHIRRMAQTSARKGPISMQNGTEASGPYPVPRTAGDEMSIAISCPLGQGYSQFLCRSEILFCFLSSRTLFPCALTPPRINVRSENSGTDSPPVPGSVQNNLTVVCSYTRGI